MGQQDPVPSQLIPHHTRRQQCQTRGVQPAQTPPLQPSKLGQVCPRASSGRGCPWDELLPNSLPTGISGGWVPSTE